MICPRCTIGEVGNDTGVCVLCGFQPGAGVAVHRPVVDEVLETVQRELEGRFRINVLLRHGTRSVVYVADEVPSKRMVALKVIPLQRGMAPDLARFQREAAVAASLSHSHIARVLGFGKTRALLWYSMEYVKGHTLADLMRDSGPLDLETCQKILEQVASALDYMHRRGVTHGNLKPSNILVDREDWARVSDACIMGAFSESGSRDRGVGGSPEYMAPEQFRGRAVGPSADQYAMGAIAYECLSGNLPFVGDAPEEMERMVLAEAPAGLEQSRDDLPPHVRESVHRALSKTPAQRFPMVLDFVAMLRKDWVPPGGEAFATAGKAGSQSQVFVIDGDKPKSRFVPVAWAALALLVIALGSIWLKPWESIVGSLNETGSPPPPSESQVQGTPTQLPQTQQPVERPRYEPLNRTEETPQAPTQPAAIEARSEAPATVTTPPVNPGKLFVNSTPWGQVYIDGELIGNTPRVMTLSAGTHSLRVVRDGFEAFELEIQLAEGQQLRLTDITLRARRP
jgi:serine/threonine-protein kinase